VSNLATDESDRKTRRVAFVVITLVFVLSVAALLYWAVNVATAHPNEKSLEQLQAVSPRTIIPEERVLLTSGPLAKSSGAIKF